LLAPSLAERALMGSIGWFLMGVIRWILMGVFAWVACLDDMIVILFLSEGQAKRAARCQRGRELLKKRSLRYRS
jgi:hypothetical protein